MGLEVVATLPTEMTKLSRIFNDLAVSVGDVHDHSQRVELISEAFNKAVRTLAHRCPHCDSSDVDFECNSCGESW